MSLAPNDTALKRVANFFNQKRAHFHKATLKSAAVPVLIGMMALSGCTTTDAHAGWLQVSTIPKSSLDNPNRTIRSGVPQEDVDRAEQYIRQSAERVHLTGTDDVISWSTGWRQMYGEAVKVSSQSELRDRYTGQFYSCTDVKVTAKISHNGHRNVNGTLRPTDANLDINRVDRVCQYEDTGRITYRKNIGPGR